MRSHRLLLLACQSRRHQQSFPSETGTQPQSAASCPADRTSRALPGIALVQPGWRQGTGVVHDGQRPDPVATQQHAKRWPTRCPRAGAHRAGDKRRYRHLGRVTQPAEPPFVHHRTCVQPGARHRRRQRGKFQERPQRPRLAQRAFRGRQPPHVLEGGARVPALPDGTVPAGRQCGSPVLVAPARTPGTVRADAFRCRLARPARTPRRGDSGGRRTGRRAGGLPYPPSSGRPQLAGT